MLLPNHIYQSALELRQLRFDLKTKQTQKSTGFFVHFYWHICNHFKESMIDIISDEFM